MYCFGTRRMGPPRARDDRAGPGSRRCANGATLYIIYYYRGTLFYD